MIGREIGVVAAGDFDPDELERAKDAMKGRLALSLESTSARMGRLGRAILHDQPLLDEDEIAARIDAVTVDDIAMLAGELFAPARLSAACIGTDEAVFSTGLDALLVGDRVTRVAVVGATGRLGTPICAGIEAAEDLTLVARVARSLGAGGYGEYASLEAALATCQVDVVLEVTGPESVEAERPHGAGARHRRRGRRHRPRRRSSGRRSATSRPSATRGCSRSPTSRSAPC